MGVKANGLLKITIDATLRAVTAEGYPNEGCFFIFFKIIFLMYLEQLHSTGVGQQKCTIYSIWRYLIKGSIRDGH